MINKPGLKNIRVYLENNTIQDCELLLDSFDLIRVHAETLSAHNNSLLNSKVSTFASFELLKGDLVNLTIFNVTSYSKFKA